MVTLPSWRRAYGALKDHTKVGIAHVTSDFKDVDVAIVKATNHVECPPKEKHLRKILVTTSSIRPRADVAYCIHALARRLAKTRNWTVALKTLIVFHRLLREGDSTFREELLNFQQRGHILHVSNFKDDSSPNAWDCSAWVRTYALFLEERLECFGILKYDIEAEGLPRPAQGSDKSSQHFSRTRELGNDELLEQLPALQQLLHRLTGCRPEGAAFGNSVIQYALALVLKESFKIYLAINDGIINLVDKFFEMTRHEAIKSVDIYKKAGQQAISLSEFYDTCKGVELARNFQFPVLREPPRSFIVTMEEYIREAPSMVPAPMVALEYPERLMLTYKLEDDVPISSEEIAASLDECELPPTAEAAISTAEEIVHPLPPTNVDIDDLLGLNSSTHDASFIEESNAAALSIVPSSFATVDSSSSQAKDFDPTGWELALVSTPSADLSSSVPQERQLAGGLDSLTLNSLYNQGTYNAMQPPLYGAPSHPFTPIPFPANGAFVMSTNGPVPTFLTAAMAQPSFNSFHSFQPAYPLPQPQPQHQHYFPVASQNPFADTGFRAYPPPAAAVTTQPQTSNPFRGSSLL